MLRRVQSAGAAAVGLARSWRTSRGRPAGAAEPLAAPPSRASPSLRVQTRDLRDRTCCAATTRLAPPRGVVFDSIRSLVRLASMSDFKPSATAPT